MVRAFAPGRVNLIGDHTDYTGGLALPMAVDLGTTVVLERGGEVVRLVSADEPDPAVVPVAGCDPTAMPEGWARYVAGVVAEVRPAAGGTGTVTTTLPRGAGLSSSAALEVAVALALGFRGPPLELALACQRAEQRAWGVPTGLMDQLASAAGRAGHALLVDFATAAVDHVPLPEGADVVVVDSGERRSVADSEYRSRHGECQAAEALVGPLRSADRDAVEAIADPVLRRRARHVVSENARVRACAACLRAGDAAGAGRLMTESHASLRDDFEVSTPGLDALVERLLALDGVYGARLTGAGFGGCVVALAAAGAAVPGRRVRAAGGAFAEEG
ncbi:MAG TPA: galactokinase family protein [Acidimicrobiales bacterium]|nr:galactokinase family protein [Acidimicrobiales bacterium]